METKILIIDTDKSELRKLREILSREGYVVMTADDWKTAHKIGSQIHLDLVLCDISFLPDL